MEKKKSNNLAVCTICGILTAIGIVLAIISLISMSNGIWMINSVIDFLLLALIAYYAIYGYRKPNGNLLKYIILIFAVPDLISVYSRALVGDAWQAVIRAITIGLLCYIAGRLHRVKQNVILMLVVTAFILIGIIVRIVNLKASIGIATQLIIWIDICVAYFLRYKEHKEAGLMDKAEK